MSELLNNKKTKLKANAVGQGLRTSETDKLKTEVNPQLAGDINFDVKADEEEPISETELLDILHRPTGVKKSAPVQYAQQESAKEQTPQTQPTPAAKPIQQTPIVQQTQPRPAVQSTPTPQSVPTPQPTTEAIAKAKREQNNPVMQEEGKRIEKANAKADKKASVKAKARAIADSNKTPAQRNPQVDRIVKDIENQLSHPLQMQPQPTENDFSYIKTQEDLDNDTPTIFSAPQSPEEKSEPQAKTETPQTKTDAPQTKEETPQVKSNEPQAKTETTQAKTEASPAKTETPQATNDATQTKSNAPQAKTNESQSKDEENDEEGEDNTQQGTLKIPREGMTYADMYKLLNPEEEDETPEQKKKREKKEKRELIIRSIADGLSAMARIYFGSKGVNIPHDPKNDLTYAYNERKEKLKKEYKTNKDAWLNGYLKAMALDEQSRKSKDTLAETKRHNLAVEDNLRTKAGQTDRRLDQADRRLDISKYKIDSDNDYHDAILDIQQQELDGKIEHWKAQEAISRLNAERARNKSKGNLSMQGYWERCLDLQNTPEGRKKINKLLMRIGANSVNNTNIKWILSHLDDSSTPAQSQTPSKPASTTQSAQKPNTKSQSVTKPAGKTQTKAKTQQKPVARQKQDVKQRSRNL